MFSGICFANFTGSGGCSCSWAENTGSSLPCSSPLTHSINHSMAEEEEHKLHMNALRLIRGQNKIRTRSQFLSTGPFKSLSLYARRAQKLTSVSDMEQFSPKKILKWLFFFFFSGKLKFRLSTITFNNPDTRVSSSCFFQQPPRKHTHLRCHLSCT